MAGASGKKLDETYKLAWLRGLKTTYYLRTLAATSAEKSTGQGGELNAVPTSGAQLARRGATRGSSRAVPRRRSRTRQVLLDRRSDLRGLPVRHAARRRERTQCTPGASRRRRQRQTDAARRRQHPQTRTGGQAMNAKTDEWEFYTDEAGRRHWRWPAAIQATVASPSARRRTTARRRIGPRSSSRRSSPTAAAGQVAQQSRRGPGDRSRVAAGRGERRRVHGATSSPRGCSSTCPSGGSSWPDTSMYSDT